MKKLIFVLFIFINYNVFSQIVEIDKDLSKADFSFLHEKIKGKKIVCVGEDEHRFESINEVKAALVDYLIEKEGFSVVVFEASMISVKTSDVLKDDPKAWVKNGMYGVWRTQSVLKMMEKMDKKINLYGFDMQRVKGINFIELLKPHYQISSKFLQEVASTDSLSQYLWYNFEINKPSPDGKIVETVFTNLKDTLISLNKTVKISKSEQDYILQCVQNNIYHGEYVANHKGFINTNILRDSINSFNLKWIIARHPNEKIIVWAANGHVAKEFPYFKSTVEYLGKEVLDRDVYSLGIFHKTEFDRDYFKNRKTLKNKHVFFDYKSKSLGKEHDGGILTSGIKKIKDYRID